MDLLRHALLFLHFVGLASLVGGFLTQLRAQQRRVVPAMIHGALTQLVSGIALVGVDHGLDRPVNDDKATVKLVVLAVVLGLIWLNRSRPSVSEAVYYGIGVLGLADIAIAVFWT